MGTNSQVVSNWLCVGYSLCHTHDLNLGGDPENVVNITDIFVLCICLIPCSLYKPVCKGKFTLYKERIELYKFAVKCTEL